jgi:hypothetical protein
VKGKTMRTARIVLVMTAALTGMWTASGQDVTAEQQKLLAKRSAEADAFRKLAEMVYGLQINSRTYVQDFVTESDQIRSDVDAFVQGVRLGEPIFYDDGSCEVPAEVTVAKVVETLREAHSRHYKGSSVKSSDFESMSRRIEKQVLKVIGMGAPRPDLPPNLPTGVVDLLTPAPTGLPPAIPDIWKSIGPQARLSAQRAAYEDAKRRLAERIKGLRLTARTQVRDFVMESDRITTELDTTLVGFVEKGYYLHGNELIAECTLALPTEQVVTTIKKLHSRYYDGDDVQGSDIEKIVNTVVKREFEATGMGIPNPRFIQAYAERAALAYPDWSLQTLEARGEGTDPEMDTAVGRLRAARAAELDARRRLAERILGLEIRSASRVEDFVLQYDYIEGMVQGLLVNAVVTDTRVTGETAVVTVALPGMRVWEVVHSEIRRAQR